MSAPQPSPTSSLSPLGEFLFAAAFWSAGLSLLAVAGDFVHLPSQTIEAPRWVLAAAGLVFLAGGFVPRTLRYGPDAWQSRLVGAMILLGLASIFNWVAFGPGARHFTSTLSFTGSAVQRATTSESIGRTVFGAFAAAIDLFVIAVAIRWVRSRKD
jgi:hypothetical protein